MHRRQGAGPWVTGDKPFKILSSMGSVCIGGKEEAPVVASGGGLHTVLHCSLNGEGLDDLAAVIQPTNTISGEVRQGQEGLHLHVDLQKPPVGDCHSPCRPAHWRCA